MPVGRHRRPGTREATGEPLDQQPTPTRPGMLLAARDHEMARMRAKLMNPTTAYVDLVEQLNFAHVQAGKPSLSTLSKTVDYSKATLSKVFTGKAMPSWVLVHRLAVHLRVPPRVAQDWYTLWTAANMSGRKPDTARGRATVPLTPGTATGSVATADTQTGYTCPKCGSWVVDTALHTGWHMEIEPSGRTAPPSESITGWNAASDEISLLRKALGDNP